MKKIKIEVSETGGIELLHPIMNKPLKLCTPEGGGEALYDMLRKSDAYNMYIVFEKKEVEG